MLIVTSRPNGQSSGEGVGPTPTRPEFDTREGHDSKRGLAAPPDPEWSNNGPLGYDEQSPGHPRTPRDDRENSWERILFNCPVMMAPYTRCTSDGVAVRTGPREHMGLSLLTLHAPWWSTMLLRVEFCDSEGLYPPGCRSPCRSPCARRAPQSVYSPITSVLLLSIV